MLTGLPSMGREEGHLQDAHRFAASVKEVSAGQSQIEQRDREGEEESQTTA